MFPCLHIQWASYVSAFLSEKSADGGILQKLKMFCFMCVGLLAMCT